MIKTAEWVTPKHPDKMADQISDAILDLYLSKDENSRVAVEVLGGHGKVYIIGEVTSDAKIDQKVIPSIVERIIGYSPNTLHIHITEQSKEIAQGVDTGGAGDQGIMVGYACNDNEEMIPQELYLSRSLGMFLFEKYPYDGKTQITLDPEGKVVAIVASFQNVSRHDLLQAITVWGLENKVNIPQTAKVYANPAGDWSQGGFDADTGLTGRKLAVDNYGPQIPIGGGAFSGKDSTKVDRSGAYMARKIAVDILKSNNAKNVVVKIAYAIGVAQPIMVSARAELTDGKILDIGWDFRKYDLTPKGIIKFLDLRKPQFEETARAGHFGRGFKWDK